MSFGGKGTYAVMLEWMDSNFAQWVRGQDRFHEVVACPMIVSQVGVERAALDIDAPAFGCRFDLR